MKAKIFGLLLVSLVMVGCNSSSNTSNGTPTPSNPGGNDINELGYDPAVRWTERGEMSYSFKHSENGRVCETGKQSFGNRAEYRVKNRIVH